MAEGPPVPDEAIHADAGLARAVRQVGARGVGVTRGADGARQPGGRPACGEQITPQYLPEEEASHNLLCFHSKSEFCFHVTNFRPAAYFIIADYRLADFTQ